MSGLSAVLTLLASEDQNSGSHDKSVGFGQFVGSWEIEATWYYSDGTQDRGVGDWHWTWILGGQAILDVLTFPSQSSTPTPSEYSHNVLIRVFDESADMWRVVWAHPRSASLNTYHGTFSDDGGVVLRNDPHGEPTKWIFSEVTHDSFLWEGFTKDSPDSDWRMDQRMKGIRTA